jgi:ATP-dependent helicase HepA
MGLIFTFTVQPNIKMLIEQGCSPKILSQFRVFLPLKPITVCIPLVKSSQDVPEQNILDLLDQPWLLRRGIHLGERGNSSIDRFMERFPEDQWINLVEKAHKSATTRALNSLKECADFQGARREINRLIAGRRAECAYFGKDENETEREVQMYQNAWEALINSDLVLDSVCFMRVIE